jgi:hypothetical protein
LPGGLAGGEELSAFGDEALALGGGQDEGGEGAGWELGEGELVGGAELGLPLGWAEDGPVAGGDPVDAGHVGCGVEAVEFDELGETLGAGGVGEDAVGEAGAGIEVDQGEHLAADGFVADPVDEVVAPLAGLDDVRELEEKGAEAFGVHGNEYRRGGGAGVNGSGWGFCGRAGWGGRVRACHQTLDPAGVEDVALAGDAGGVVGGEEEGEAGDLFGDEEALEGLAGEDLGDVFGGVPELVLAWGLDGAGKDGVDADVVRAELVGEGAGEADEGGLGGDVDGKARGRDDPGDRTHINDGAALALLHAGKNGLGDEELVLEVEGEGAVPGGGGYVFGGVAGVVAGVVDEDVESGVGGEEGGEGAVEGGLVGEVAGEVDGRVRVMGEAGEEGLGGGVVAIEEEDLGALGGEGFDERGADAAGAAGDEDEAVAEAGVGGELGSGLVGHGRLREGGAVFFILERDHVQLPARIPARRRPARFDCQRNGRDSSP